MNLYTLNLQQYKLKLASADYRASTVIAIDACLGVSRNVGCISVKKGPLRPGTGVNKRLPWIGDYHIIGIVNVSGFMEHVVLQNTRLSLVMRWQKSLPILSYLPSAPGLRTRKLLFPPLLPFRV